MITALWIGGALVVVVGLSLALRGAVRAYLEFRGTRVVICPEIMASAAVEVDARHAAATSALGGRCLRLTACSRWPEREDCGQECLRQIELAPRECLARTMLVRFYEGRSCALCGHAFGAIQWFDNRPALMSPEHRTLRWQAIRPEWLPEVLATHLPVCWNCHIAETFRRRDPELVIERPPPRQSA